MIIILAALESVGFFPLFGGTIQVSPLHEGLENQGFIVFLTKKG